MGKTFRRDAELADAWALEAERKMKVKKRQKRHARRFLSKCMALSAVDGLFVPDLSSSDLIDPPVFDAI
ncbi:hypothetical protein [Magnetospirillum molischianum]|uniref:Uncharacterized protein n=1 Tax=Magnetospirillum molischianum DSM 120 TaxID=1150626 RepID=H8FY16_MAGML|nr:hypothetical protein [Magnetospirillum molischianum]CCG43254.1 hypothetical protein PHAMO_80045 [Magnetospirillum molischianum DSM 120]